MSPKLPEKKLEYASRILIREAQTFWQDSGQEY